MTNFPLETRCDFRPMRFYTPRSATHRVAVAVSACLTGDNVRYDGTNKLLPVYPLLRHELNLVAVCPEISAGLGVPRPPIQLVEVNGQIHAIGRENRKLNVTSALQSFAAASLRQLLDDHLLCGYLWKSRSPSCGFGSTPLFTVDGIEIRRTSGVHADHFRRHLPYLNHCEEAALETTAAAQNFILGCRLVFDLLYASDATLSALHQHYAFLYKDFDACTTEKLNALSATNNKANYIATFLEGCNQVPKGILLQLFK